MHRVHRERGRGTEGDPLQQHVARIAQGDDQAALRQLRAQCPEQRVVPPQQPVDHRAVLEPPCRQLLLPLGDQCLRRQRAGREILQGVIALEGIVGRVRSEAVTADHRAGRGHRGDHAFHARARGTPDEDRRDRVVFGDRRQLRPAQRGLGLRRQRQALRCLGGMQVHPGAQSIVVLAGTVLDRPQPGTQGGPGALGRTIVQGLHAGDRGGRVALEQAVDQSHFARDPARLQRDDALGHGFSRVFFVVHVVQAQARLQRRQMLGHGLQPALADGDRFRAPHGLDGEARHPQIVDLRMVGQRRIQRLPGLLLAPQALPGHQQQLQRVAIGWPLRQHRQQVLERLQRLPGLQLQLAGQAAHGRAVAGRRRQHLTHHLGGHVHVALAQRQLHDQALQRGDARVQFQHAAEALLGERQHVLAHVSEAERIQHPRIARQRFAGG
ncbi:hypothetical protein D3C71_1165030 [compost metagenome]